MTTKTASRPGRATPTTDDPEPTLTELRQKKALEDLRAAHAAVKAFDRVDGTSPMDQAVAACRLAGWTWYSVAEALEQHEPNVVRKYGPTVKALLAGTEPAVRADPLDKAAGDAIYRLRVTAAAVEKAKAVRVAAVAKCRQERVTWNAIADVVGQRPTNAVQKYGKLLEERVQVVVRKQPTRPRS